MDIQYHKWYSPALGRDMELKIYGHAGKPILVFPSSGGRFYEYEDFGMVGACRNFIENGKVTLFAVDSADHESWLNFGIAPSQRLSRHLQYETYILDEAVPFIRYHRPLSQKLMTTGCSMGAYHAANFLFRHPEVFDGVIALSGLYGPDYLLNGYMDDSLYFHFPLVYLPGLNDPQYLDKYRTSRLIFCVGQGAWERCDQYDCMSDTLSLKTILESKHIPAWVDVWGHDVSHDWVWWRLQMPYFLEKAEIG